MTALRTERLDVSIGPVQVCIALELEIRPGECWCILGRNGAGKTTLLHTLCGLQQQADSACNGLARQAAQGMTIQQHLSRISCMQAT